MEQQVSAEAVIGRYEQELAQMTRRMIIAEAHAAALAEELAAVNGAASTHTDPEASREL